jgi:hypothetical protein
MSPSGLCVYIEVLKSENFAKKPFTFLRRKNRGSYCLYACLLRSCDEVVKTVKESCDENTVHVSTPSHILENTM